MGTSAESFYENLLIANAALYILVALYYFTRRFASANHPATFYILVHGIVFVLRPFYAWYGRYDLIYDLYQFTPSMDTKITTLLTAALAYVIVMACLMIAAPMKLPYVAWPKDIRRSLRKPLLAVAVVVGPLALYSSSVSWSNRAYDADTMVNSANGIRVNTEAVGYVQDAQLMLVPLTVLFVWVFRFRPWVLALAGAYILLRAGTGGRGPMVITVAALSLAYLYEHRRAWPTPRVLAAAAGCLLLFTAIGEDRGAAIRGFFLSDQIEEQRFNTYSRPFFDGMDFANLEYVEYVVETVPEKTGTFDYFLRNLQIFTEPVPRVLWEGKPLGAPIQLFDLWDYGTPIGATYAVPGMGWIQMGWTGVAIWAAFFGFGLAAIHRYAAKNIHSPYVYLAYTVFLACLIVYLRDGTLLTIVRTQVFYLAPIFLLFLFSRNARRRSTAFSSSPMKAY